MRTLPGKSECVFAALALLAFVCHAAIGVGFYGEASTTHAIAGSAIADDTLTLPDFDDDGTVGFGDFVKFAENYGLGQGDDGYDARYDLDGDGAIGFSDLLIFAENFGKEVPSDDRAVLVALYNATDGPNWRFKTNWLSDKHLREWYGVSTDANGRVTRLDLYAVVTSSGDTVGVGSIGRNVGNGLSGEIPAELGRLSNLTQLSLVGNKLTGTIPTQLGRLSNLTRLILTRNQLTGTIPPELGQLSNLTDLSLGRNQLTGTIPSELLNLSNLISLALGDNQLTGTIPPDLGKLTRLWELWLPRCGLTGTIPNELGQITALEYLTLQGNQLTGTIPAGLGNLSNLVELWLDYNQLTGTIPPELGQLDSLTTLTITGNANLSGPIPESFTRLALDIFHLSGTAVCIPLYSEFEDWLETVPDRQGVSRCVNPELDALIVLFTQTNGPNWTNSQNWTTLAPLDEWYGVATDDSGRVVRLTLRDNNLTGFLPSSLSALTRLKTMNLAFNGSLSGPLPQGLTGLPLEFLELNGTRLCAPPFAEFQAWLNGIPDSDVARCTDTRPDYYPLVALYSATNGANWSTATNWASAAPLDEWHGVTTDADGRVTELTLRHNKLRGPVVPGLGQLKKLKSLDLASDHPDAGRNELTGEIPPELGHLTNLTNLDLFGNRLTGRIPSSVLGRLSHLSSLNLGVNGFTGEIPTELAQLSDLTVLNLGYNRLTGNIPSELGELTRLKTLDLQDNPLDGTIPPELGRLRNLERLVLWFNNLSGEIPPELGRLTNLRELHLVDNYFTGQIPPELGQLINLEQMLLINNTLTGEIPSQLGQLNKLRGLNLTVNQLTGEIPPELGQLNNLNGLYLSRNQLSGEIPAELGQLNNLGRLDLSSNQLSGNIPSELRRLSNLTELYLSRNQLSGEIPAKLGQLNNLGRLDLSSNQLAGNIPPELGQLRNLTSLNLGFNGALSGTLPAALTALTLENLRLNETLLCSPQDAGFQAWLRGITYSRVPNCARSDEAAAYLVQATQSLEYPVPLLAGDAALLRVFVTAAGGVDAAMPPVRATFYMDGVEVHTANIAGQTTNIPPQINEASLLNSANAVVPGSVVMPGLEMVVEIDPDRTLDPALGVSARLPATGRTGLEVRSVPPFHLTLIPFLWEENPDRSVLAQIEGLSSDSDLFRLTRDILPVRDFRLTVHEPVWTSVDPTSDASSVLGPETELIYAMEGAKGYYMSIFRSVGESGLQGIARLPGFVSLSILDGNVIAHELGHNLNLFHAPACGAAGSDPDYPYDEGAIGAWGYDFANESLVSPATSDLMTYCKPQWISDYSFTRALARRTQVESAPLAAAKAASTKGLLLWGGLNESSELSLEPAFVVTAPPSLPRMDGPYALTGEDEHGDTLFSLPFGMPEYGCGSKGGSFAFILPVRDEWAGRLARVTLEGPEGVSILDGQEDPSATLLLERGTGDVRGILRDWPAAAAKRPTATLGLSEPDVEVITSNGIPDAASWRR